MEFLEKLFQIFWCRGIDDKEMSVCRESFDHYRKFFRTIDIDIPSFRIDFEKSVSMISCGLRTILKLIFHVHDKFCSLG